jgi:hypothetical protein
MDIDEQALDLTLQIVLILNTMKVLYGSAKSIFCVQQTTVKSIQPHKMHKAVTKMWVVGQGVSSPLFYI